MLFIVVLLSVLAVLDAAPSNLDHVKTSNHGPAYGAPSYTPPQCGASYYHVAQAPHALDAPYGYQHGPPAPYGYQQAQPAPYGYQQAQPSPYPSYMPHYRSDFDNDLSSIQHMDQMAQMRAYGEYNAAAPTVSGPAPGPYAQAVGLYPGANIGGCKVPLLVSCSPSITQGQMLKSSVHYGAAGAAPTAAHPLPVQTLPAYRGADSTMEVHNEDKHGLKEAKQSQDHLDAAHDHQHVDKNN